MSESKIFHLLNYEFEPEKGLFKGLGGHSKNKLFSRDRLQHGNFIKKQLSEVQIIESKIKKVRQYKGFDEKKGICLTISGKVGHDLLVERFDNLKFGFELLSDNREKIEDDSDFPERAVVFIQFGKVSKFIQIVDEYIKKNTNGNPTGLLSSIEKNKLKEGSRIKYKDEEYLVVSSLIPKYPISITVKKDKSFSEIKIECKSNDDSLDIVKWNKSEVQDPNTSIIVSNPNPKNKDLIESIEEIKLATIKDFWTDSSELFPEENKTVYWEVWLRKIYLKNNLDTFNEFKSEFD